MKKLILVLIIYICYHFVLNGLTFADLDLDHQYIVKDFVIDYDEEVTESNFSELEGIEYEIVYESENYIIVVVDGKYLVVPAS